jgi:hypothetical protein
VGIDEVSQGGRFGRWVRAGLALLVLVFASAPASAADQVLFSIGTGGKTGVYYLAGGAICELVNDRRWDTGIRCLAKSSDGSIQNLRDVRSGRRSFGIVQSDWQHHAVAGTGVFADVGPDTDLRSVFSLFAEAFTVVARPEAGIAGLGDLPGKRVSFGPAGSGGRATMNVVMQAMGWSDTDFAYIADLPMAATPTALCNGEIDAAIFIVAHPNLTVEEMMSSCGAVLVPVDVPEIAAMIKDENYYAPYEIPPATYADQTTGVPTFAPTATLVTSARTSPAVVFEVVKAVLDNLDAFRAVHPAFAALDRTRMLHRGLTAPLHEGVIRYLRGSALPATPASSGG